MLAMESTFGCSKPLFLLALMLSSASVVVEAQQISSTHQPNPNFVQPNTYAQPTISNVQQQLQPNTYGLSSSGNVLQSNMSFANVSHDGNSSNSNIYVIPIVNVISDPENAASFLKRLGIDKASSVSADGSLSIPLGNKMPSICAIPSFRENCCKDECRKLGHQPQDNSLFTLGMQMNKKAPKRGHPPKLSITIYETPAGETMSKLCACTYVPRSQAEFLVSAALEDVATERRKQRPVTVPVTTDTELETASDDQLQQLSVGSVEMRPTDNPPQPTQSEIGNRAVQTKIPVDLLKGPQMQVQYPEQLQLNPNVGETWLQPPQARMQAEKSSPPGGTPDLLPPALPEAPELAHGVPETAQSWPEPGQMEPLVKTETQHRFWNPSQQLESASAPLEWQEEPEVIAGPTPAAKPSSVGVGKSRNHGHEMRKKNRYRKRPVAVTPKRVLDPNSVEHLPKGAYYVDSPPGSSLFEKPYKSHDSKCEEYYDLEECHCDIEGAKKVGHYIIYAMPRSRRLTYREAERKCAERGMMLTPVKNQLDYSILYENAHPDTEYWMGLGRPGTLVPDLSEYRWADGDFNTDFLKQYVDLGPQSGPEEFCTITFTGGKRRIVITCKPAFHKAHYMCAHDISHNKQTSKIQL